MLRLRCLACALILLALPASRAAAQEPPAAPPGPPAAQPAAPTAPPGAPQPGQPAYPQLAPPAYSQPGQPAYPQPAPPGYGQPVYPPGYGPPAAGYGPGYAQPGYGPPGYGPPGPPGYGPGYGYEPQAPPPPPPAPSPLRWSLRYDPFDLLTRRLTFQAEVAVAGPFAIEVAPSWIFGSPSGGLDEKGFSITANAVFYLSGLAFRGLWLKAHFEYENYSAAFANPYDTTLVGPSQRLSSGIFGALFGDSLVIPRTGGFILSGGIGVGVATAGTATIASGSGGATGAPVVTTTIYDGVGRVRLLGSLGLGVAF